MVIPQESLHPFITTETGNVKDFTSERGTMKHFSSQKAVCPFYNSQPIKMVLGTIKSGILQVKIPVYLLGRTKAMPQSASCRWLNCSAVLQSLGSVRPWQLKSPCSKHIDFLWATAKSKVFFRKQQHQSQAEPQWERPGRIWYLQEPFQHAQPPISVQAALAHSHWISSLIGNLDFFPQLSQGV